MFQNKITKENCNNSHIQIHSLEEYLTYLDYYRDTDSSYNGLCAIKIIPNYDYEYTVGDILHIWKITDADGNKDYYFKRTGDYTSLNGLDMHDGYEEVLPHDETITKYLTKEQI